MMVGNMETLTSVPDVLKALGGVYKAAIILNENPSTVGNWQTRSRIPPEHFLTVSKALKEAGKTVSPDVFGMKFLP